MTTTCNKCGKKFTDIYGLKRHYDRKTPSVKEIIVLKCDTCRKHFKTPYTFKKHLNRRYPCKRPEHLVCDRCDIVFSCKYNLKRHRDLNCSGVSVAIIHDMQEKIKALESQVSTNTTNNNTHNGDSNVHNGNNITVNINNYGAPMDISHLNNLDIQRILDRKNGSLLMLGEKINFDPNKPENHNIRMLQKDDKQPQVFNDGEWGILTMKDGTPVDVIGDYTKKLYAKLVQFYEEEEGKLRDLDYTNGLDESYHDMFDHIRRKYEPLTEDPPGTNPTIVWMSNKLRELIYYKAAYQGSKFRKTFSEPVDLSVNSTDRDRKSVV